MELRPRDIYIHMTKAGLQKWLGKWKPLGFRVPVDGEYFVATSNEQKNVRVSEGSGFVPYKCYDTWHVPTPRFIISKEAWTALRY